MRSDTAGTARHQVRFALVALRGSIVWLNNRYGSDHARLLQCHVALRSIAPPSWAVVRSRKFVAMLRCTHDRPGGAPAAAASQRRWSAAIVASLCLWTLFAPRRAPASVAPAELAQLSALSERLRSAAAVRNNPHRTIRVASGAAPQLGSSPPPTYRHCRRRRAAPDRNNRHGWRGVGGAEAQRQSDCSHQCPGLRCDSCDAGALCQGVHRHGRNALQALHGNSQALLLSQFCWSLAALTNVLPMTLFHLETNAQSHKITDLTGTASFALSAIATHAATSRALGTSALAPSRGSLLAGCVSLWALRLGGYLFYRVMQVGSAALRCAALCCAMLHCSGGTGGKAGGLRLLASAYQSTSNRLAVTPRQAALLAPYPFFSGWQGRPARPVFPAARRAAADGPQQVSGCSKCASERKKESDTPLGVG